MITDEQLKAAALELDSALMENLPEPGEQEFSPRFERKMKRLLRKGRPSAWVNHCLRAAAVLLTVLLVGGIVLISSPETLAEFRGLFYEVEQEHRYRYVLEGWVEEEDMCAYRMGWIPEGYELRHSEIRYTHGMQTYANAEKHVLNFNYVIQTGKGGVLIHRTFSAVDYELKDTIVNGQGANLFVITQKSGAVTYTVIWMNAERSVLFEVSGARSEAEAVRIAESIERTDPEQ